MNKKFFPRLIAGFLLLLFFSLSWFMLNRTNISGDLAEFLNNPLRIIQGQRPYYDFWLVFPPGDVYLPYFVYQLFGTDIRASLLLLAMSSALIGWFSFLIGQLILKDVFWSATLALIVFFNGVGTSYYKEGGFYFLFLLIAVWLWLKKRNLFIVGTFIGLAFYFRFYETSAVLLAFLVSLIYQQKNRKKSGFLLLGLLITILPIFIFFPPQMLLQEVIIKPISHAQQMSLPYFISLQQIFAIGSLSFPQWLKAANYLVLYLLPLFVSVFALIRRKKMKTFIWFFLLWSLFSLPKAFGRSDISHLVYATTPFLFVLIYLLKQKFNFILGLCLIFLLVPTTYHPKKFFQQYFTVQALQGKFYLNDKDKAEEINQLIQAIETHTQPNDYIFVTPWMAPPLYVLTGRQNPTYYDSLIDVQLQPTQEKQQSVCEDLLTKPIKLIIHRTDWNFDNRPKTSFPQAVPLLQKCFDDNFSLIKEVNAYQLLIPKT